MNESQRKARKKRLSFYCSENDCNIIKTGYYRSGKPRLRCRKCKRTSEVLENPIDFSNWTEIDIALDKKMRRYHFWKRNFDLLKAFSKEHGHTWIPLGSTVKSIAIYEWVARQRLSMRRNKLHPLQVKLLESIDFKLDYESNDDVTTTVRESRNSKRRKFPEQFKIILAWKQKYGRWPRKRLGNNEEEQKLGRIVSEWRSANKLYDDEMDQLDKHGFIWSMNDYKFRKKIERLKAFKQKFGVWHLIEDKSPTSEDRETMKIILRLGINPPKKEWQLKELKALNIGTIKDKKS